MSDDEDEVAEGASAPTIEDGDEVEVQGSSGTYTLSRHGSVLMCTCMAWKNQGAPVDIELWVGRKMFQKTTSIVRSGAAGAEWKQVQYVVFDAPNATGGFEERLAHAQKVLERAAAPHARWHEHVVCNSFDHLREELARVESLGGEGLMLRKPKSKYEA